MNTKIIKNYIREIVGESLFDIILSIINNVFKYKIYNHNYIIGRIESNVSNKNTIENALRIILNHILNIKESDVLVYVNNCGELIYSIKLSQIDKKDIEYITNTVFYGTELELINHISSKLKIKFINMRVFNKLNKDSYIVDFINESQLEIKNISNLVYPEFNAIKNNFIQYSISGNKFFCRNAKLLTYLNSIDGIFNKINFYNVVEMFIPSKNNLYSFVDYREHQNKLTKQDLSKILKIINKDSYLFRRLIYGYIQYLKEKFDVVFIKYYDKYEYNTDTEIFIFNHKNEFIRKVFNKGLYFSKIVFSKTLIYKLSIDDGVRFRYSKNWMEDGLYEVSNIILYEKQVYIEVKPYYSDFNKDSIYILKDYEKEVEVKND